MIDDLSSFQRDLLVVADALDDPNGNNIREVVSDLYDEPVNHPRLYPALDQLVENGLLTKDVVSRRENAYDTTADGRELIGDRLEWMAELYS